MQFRGNVKYIDDNNSKTKNSSPNKKHEISLRAYSQTSYISEVKGYPCVRYRQVFQGSLQKSVITAQRYQTRRKEIVL